MSDELNEKSAEKPGVTIETAPAAQKTKGRPTQAKSKEKQGSSKLNTWFKEIRAEAGKIIWPNRKELAKMTVTVIFTSLLFGALIAGMDTVFRFITGILVNLI